MSEYRTIIERKLGHITVRVGESEYNKSGYEVRVRNTNFPASWGEWHFIGDLADIGIAFELAEKCHEDLKALT